MPNSETTKIVETKTIKVGEIGVDAGICWIGDPCYILGDKPRPKECGANWDEFCHNLFNKPSRQHAQFNYDLGHAGLGVTVQTGYGDGTYPVYAEIKDGRVAKVWVEFIPHPYGLEDPSKG